MAALTSMTSDSSENAPTLTPDNPAMLAQALIDAVNEGAARRKALQELRELERQRRIRAIFDTLVNSYLFSRIADAIAIDANSIDVPLGNAAPEELAEALRIVPGISVAPFDRTIATRLKVTWSAAVASETLKFPAPDLDQPSNSEPAPVIAIAPDKGFPHTIERRFHDDDGRAAFDIAASHRARGGEWV